jgi:hypothetical protein
MTVAAAASALRLVGYITRQEKEANDPISLAIDRLLQVNIYITADPWPALQSGSMS